MPTRRSALALTLFWVVTLLLLLGTPGALAASPTTIQIQPSSQVISPENRTASLVVDVTAGNEGAAFGLAIEPGQWPRSSAALVGSPVVPEQVGIIGGAIRAATQDVLPPPVLIRRDACRRERAAGVESYAFWVEVPANSRAQIVVDTALSFPAWPRTAYQLQFSTFSPDSQTAPRSPLAAVDVPISGPLGRLISMRFAQHRFRYFLTHGMMPGLVGSTSPPLRNGQIALRVVRPTRAGSVLPTSWKTDLVAKLGVVQTDRHGRFEIPAGSSLPSGHYALVARSSASKQISPDWNCGPFFDVRSAGP